uniref:helicase-related protein n=1 Tax=Tessaracoccus bendigoensis TaxID=72764 RepID=UPI001C31577D|nr:helicase-related protein [Tessaracoccus bendigoensis]
MASSATVRNAAEQVRCLYGRRAAIFPPQVLDAGSTWFSSELPISAEHPGRRYVGVCASGVRMTAAEIRLSEVLLAAGQLLLDVDPASADPYLTLVAYFNATRELAGMSRFLQDDVQTALWSRRPWSRLPGRRGTDYGNQSIAELTSRASSTAITTRLDQMATPFDPDFDTTAARAARIAALEAHKPLPDREQTPFDVVLATSMLQVGVDVPRLGLMLIVGQPKNTAEYIQASSRVGRSASGPGLVVTLGNWARPRDLAHFEQFRHYHETFYAQVEALSVTPYSITSIERGLDGVLVSAARVLAASKGADSLSPEDGAERVEAEAALLDGLVARLARRAQAAADDKATATLVEQRLANRVDQWRKRRIALHQQGLKLVYERVRRGASQGALMQSAEAGADLDPLDRPPFTVANSMREVQPEINLLVSPDSNRLAIRPPDNQPVWAFPATQED